MRHRHDDEGLPGSARRQYATQWCAMRAQYCVRLRQITQPSHRSKGWGGPSLTSRSVKPHHNPPSNRKTTCANRSAEVISKSSTATPYRCRSYYRCLVPLMKPTHTAIAKQNKSDPQDTNETPKHRPFFCFLVCLL